MFPSSFSAATIGLGSLRENPLRTVLSTLGVIIGVAALVSVLSLGDAMQSFVRGQIESTTDVQTWNISARTRILVDGEWEPVVGYPRFTPGDLRDLAALPMVRASAMQLGGSARVSWARSGKDRRAGITAVTAGIEQFGGLDLVAGRPFTEAEAAHDAPVVILSHKLAAELANGRGAESMVGDLVRVRGATREVIAVQAPIRGERGFSALVPYTGAASALGPGAPLETPTLMLQARTVEDMPALRQAIEDWLATRYRQWEGKVDLQTRERQLEQAMQGVTIMKLFLGALAGISLLVGGIGIMNIMLANVTERTREIGVRKAIGARGSDIKVQFLTEAVAVSAFGSAIGVGLGAAITALTLLGIRLYSKAEGLAFAISPSTVLIAALSAVAIGLTFGTYPARRAARLSPIDAIRHE